MYKLFVGGFPLVRDKQTRKCKGYAFVEMLTEKAAAHVAAALDGTIMEGRESVSGRLSKRLNLCVLYRPTALTLLQEQPLIPSADHPTNRSSLNAHGAPNDRSSNTQKTAIL
ncbi:hypothetical protein [Mucilaginibacter sp. UR6-1]|uniref:hypothetical protein n=1 Tax=Mucilaginibacter sp. UR6-1 TaxID=1435643 RepID=UPI00351D6297